MAVVSKLSLVSLDTRKKDKLDLSPNALRVLERRYLKKNENGEVIETAVQMFSRVAHNVAQADLFYNPKANISSRETEFYNLMTNLEFIPNSPTLMNAGGDLQQLSACFVLPINDSMDSIFDAVKQTALIHKSGGGTGFSFSRLRPKNSTVKTTRGVSSGPISFMTVFDAATETIKQGGTRRGANMGILRVDHPDILEFITCKEKTDKLNNFNISVALTDEFMKAYEENRDYRLVFPPTGQEVEKISAKKVFDLIVKMAHKNGEPGIIFIDRINHDNPTPHIGEIESTNPCGEQPLLPYESCNLGSINLSKVVKEVAPCAIDYEKLSRIVQTSVRFLDNVIDMNNYPLPQIDEMTKGNRKIGLGVMGFADMLIKLGIPYNSDKAVAIADEVMKFITQEARATSAEIAKERGAFPNFKGSIYDKPNRPAMRNATVTTIAPTGTISIIANCSSGVEPLFAITYIRNVMDNDKLIEVHPLFKEIAIKEGFYSDDLMKQIAEHGTLQGIESIPSKIQKVFCTAHDISPQWHVRIQSAFQKHTDNAVSKTVNFHQEATIRDVEKAYLLAYHSGCKGITIYRDGSRQGQVLQTGTAKKEKYHEVEKFRTPRPRPLLTKGMTQKIETGCGHLYITINEDNQGICEVFAQMGKSGGCAASQSEATSRLISLALRSGVDIESIIKQIKGIRCPSPSWQNGGTILSCPDAIANAMERYINNGNSIKNMLSPTLSNGALTNGKNLSGACPECPECNSMVEFVDGCVVCRYCGFSKCV